MAEKKLRILPIVFFLLIYPFLNFVCGQNLANNPSFEEYYDCPKMVNFKTFPAKGWYSPCNWGTPDYYHKCSSNPYRMVPKSRFGTYSPRTGDAYIGIVLIKPSTQGGEYIQSQLIEPLKREKKYKVSFYVQFADSISIYCFDNIGAFFSEENTFHVIGGCTYLENIKSCNEAKISNLDGKYLCDTGWIEISGEITAKGGEKYITIGMFWDEEPHLVKLCRKVEKRRFASVQMDKKFAKIAVKYLVKSNLKRKKEYEINPPGELFPIPYEDYAYYFIDDVSVIEIKE